MLVIVESPTKAKKIRGMINATVIATMGHFKDLPSGELAVDLETYQPTFKIAAGKGDVLKRIKTAAKGDQVIVASDPDREGYAIGMMLYEEVKKLATSVKRAEIHEVTEKGVKSALAAAVSFEKTNRGLYNAFLGRRVGDRLVGYILSPQASNTLHGTFSVGRVQSPAVRLVVDREREIRNFRPEPYWVLSIDLEKDARAFKASYAGGKFIDKAQTSSILQAVTVAGTAKVLVVETKETKQNAKAPFTTVDLQATANSQLKIGTERTMQLAQQLFEAGLISYHRTDSVRLADEFIAEIRDYIQKTMGGNYLPPSPIAHKSKNSQADAHEAIRPTHMHNPLDIPTLIAREGLTAEHERLYTLIFRRAVASQMAAAIFDATTALFDCAGHQFKATGRVQKFDGFLAIYSEQKETEETDGAADQNLPTLIQGETVKKTGENLAEKMTTPPARWTEGSLVKELERLGIGRPSTYASIMAVITRRGYVVIKKGKLESAPPGEQLVDHLKATSSWVIDYGMTKEMEAYLDHVEANENGATWQAFTRELHGKMNFAKPQGFVSTPRTGPSTSKPAVTGSKPTTMGKKKAATKGAKNCPKCKKPLVKRKGSNGEFWGCSGFPNCKHTEKV